MRVYADASLLVALFTPDTFTDRAEAFLKSGQHVLVVSDFTSAEVSSAVARKLRMGIVQTGAAQAALHTLDEWASLDAERAELHASDIREAERFVRRFALKLRTADAINIAIARRLSLPLVTFDHGLEAAATALGMEPVAC